jgi:hypothetical protein
MLQNGIRADSRGFTGTYGRKCGGMSTGAWGCRCHRHVHGRVAGQCAGIWDATLALDARTSTGTVGTGRTDVAHGLLALDVRDVAKRGRSWLGIDRRGRRSLKRVRM